MTFPAKTTLMNTKSNPDPMPNLNPITDSVAISPIAGDLTSPVLA